MKKGFMFSKASILMRLESYIKIERKSLTRLYHLKLDKDTRRGKLREMSGNDRIHSWV
jgi:hypothetical protein